MKKWDYKVILKCLKTHKTRLKVDMPIYRKKIILTKKTWVCPKWNCFRWQPNIIAWCNNPAVITIQIPLLWKHHSMNVMPILRLRGLNTKTMTAHYLSKSPIGQLNMTQLCSNTLNVNPVLLHSKLKWTNTCYKYKIYSLTWMLANNNVHLFR